MKIKHLLSVLSLGALMSLPTLGGAVEGRQIVSSPRNEAGIAPAAITEETTFTEGNGTLANPFIIDCTDHFALFIDKINNHAADVTSGGLTYGTSYYKMVDDIKIKDDNRCYGFGTDAMVKDTSGAYNFHLDGGNYTLLDINKLSTVKNEAGNEFYTGFFSVMPGNIRNLGLEINGNIYRALLEENKTSYLGCLGGLVKGTLNNVHVSIKDAITLIDPEGVETVKAGSKLYVAPYIGKSVGAKIVNASVSYMPDKNVPIVIDLKQSDKTWMGGFIGSANDTTIENSFIHNDIFNGYGASALTYGLLTAEAKNCTLRTSYVYVNDITNMSLKDGNYTPTVLGDASGNTINRVFYYEKIKNSLLKVTGNTANAEQLAFLVPFNSTLNYFDHDNNSKTDVVTLMEALESFKNDKNIGFETTKYGDWRVDPNFNHGLPFIIQRYLNRTYRIGYFTDGGNIAVKAPTGYTYGETTILPDIVTKDGYRFAGWYVDTYYSGSPVKQINPDEFGHKIFVAKWIEDDPEPQPVYMYVIYATVGVAALTIIIVLACKVRKYKATYHKQDKKK